jgi:hypothetical protein
MTGGNPTTLTLRTLVNHGILSTLGQLFNNANRATTLLDAVGFPRQRRPDFGSADNPELFWHGICQDIQDGIIQGRTLDDLVEAAAYQFPGNSVLSRSAQPTEVSEARDRQGVSIFVTG